MALRRGLVQRVAIASTSFQNLRFASNRTPHVIEIQSAGKFLLSLSPTMFLFHVGSDWFTKMLQAFCGSLSPQKVIHPRVTEEEKINRGWNYLSGTDDWRTDFAVPSGTYGNRILQRGPVLKGKLGPCCLKMLGPIRKEFAFQNKI